MNLKHYEEIYSTLKMCHPELEKEVIDYRPISFEEIQKEYLENFFNKRKED